MAEATGTDKKAIHQQASAMLSSVLSQERVISYLRTLEFPADDPAIVQHMAETIDVLQSARQDLVTHFDFLEVAHVHGWDAARIFRDDPEESSKRVQQAVSKAKKKKEADDKERKRKKARRSSSSSNRRRDKDRDSDKQSSSSHSHCCPPPSCSHQPYQRQYRSNQNLPCIRCGDTAHHWRQCPKPATK